MQTSYIIKGWIQFNLVEETICGSTYFRPMSQERLDTFDKRPDFKEILFDDDDCYPTEGIAYLIQDAIYEQLFPSEYEAENEEDLKRANGFTPWEPIRSVHLIKKVLYTIGWPGEMKNLLRFREVVEGIRAS